MPTRRARRISLATAAAASFAVAALAPSAAHAEDLIIKYPGEHPSYVFDAEPHALVGYGAFDHGAPFGFGFRGTFRIVENGFVKTINNSIGIGVGADFFVNGGHANEMAVLVPVVMQWNFWLSTHWAVFGEPGLAVAFNGKHDVEPIFAAGGRFHFTERIALTLRIGYPAISAGVSFYL